jgi:hypothetical protein
MLAMKRQEKARILQKQVSHSVTFILLFRCASGLLRFASLRFFIKQTKGVDDTQTTIAHQATCGIL